MQTETKLLRYKYYGFLQKIGLTYTCDLKYN